MKPLRILLADDHSLVRDGLRSLLEGEGFQVVAEATDGAQAVALASEQRPEIAILDLAMPVINGIEAARKILEVSPHTKPILLTMHADNRYVLEGLRAGAAGYVLKTRAAAALVEAIREVAAGKLYVNTGVSAGPDAQVLAGSDQVLASLSPRELQVLKLIAEGKTTKELAAEIGVSPRTAESHRSRIMDKLNIHKAADLVRYAIRRGLVQP